MPRRYHLIVLAVALLVACAPDTRERTDSGSAPPAIERSEAAAVPAADATAPVPELFAEYDELPASHRGLVGAAHPPAPVGYDDLGGGLIPSPPGTTWSLSQLRSGEERLLTLDSLTHSLAGKAHWLTVVAVQLPALRDSSEHIVEVDCLLDGKADLAIVAIGRWVTTGSHLQDLDSIRLAVRPNVPRRRFDRLPLERVTCWVDENRR